MPRKYPESAVKFRVPEDVAFQLGYHPADLPNLTEPEVLDFMLGINEHITARMVRRAIAKRDLVPVRKGKKFLYSRREAIRWMQTSEGPLAGHNRGGGDAA